MIRTLVPLIFSFLLGGCNIFSPCKDEELLRIASPDGRVDAVLIRRNCGATISYSYRVYIVPKGEVYKKKSQPVFVADRVDGEILQWLAPRLLEIKYKQARIFEFTNFWQSRDVDNFNYVVAIREIPLTPPLQNTKREEKKGSALEPRSEP